MSTNAIKNIFKNKKENMGRVTKVPLKTKVTYSRPRDSVCYFPI